MNLYRRLLPYGVAIGSTAIAVLLSLWLEEIITRTMGAFFYIAIATTWYGGMRAGIVAIVLSALAVNYFFIKPIYKIQIASFEDVFRLILFVIVGLIISLLSAIYSKASEKLSNSTAAWRKRVQIACKLP